MIGKRDGTDRLFLLVRAFSLTDPRCGRLRRAGRHRHAALVGRVRHARQNHSCRLDLFVNLLQRRGRDGCADVGGLGVCVCVGQLCRNSLSGEDIVHKGALVLVSVVLVKHVLRLRCAGQVDGLLCCRRVLRSCARERVEVCLNFCLFLKLGVEFFDFLHFCLRLGSLAFVQQLLRLVHQLLALGVVKFFRHFSSPLSFKNFSFASTCARSGIKKPGSFAWLFMKFSARRSASSLSMPE